ncbi:hypothetical protein AB0M54_40200, partial [Actinoplanes sp. NPDC051470]|uniref:hypothetical protein n=1 Tax=Actinoplanes sp. NPDC051470 TaxID=3157224 RepID=UPI003415F168
MPYGDLDIPRELYGVYGMIKWFAMGEDYPPQSESTIRSAEAKMAAFSADYARASSGVEHLAARIPQVLEGETADLAYAETSTVMQGVADDLALMSIAAQLTLGLALTTEHTKITLIQGMAFIAVEFAEAVTYPGIGFAIAMEWIAFGGLLFYATRVAGRSKLMNTAVKLAELRGTPVPGAAGRSSNLQDLLRAAQQTGSIPKVFSAATVREALEKHGLINIAAKMLKEGTEEGVQEISENIFAQAVQYAQEKRKGTKDFDTESAITDFVAGLLIGLLISKYNLIGNKMFGKNFMHRGRVQGLLEGAAEVPVEAGMIGVLGGSFGGLGATFVNAFLTGALPMELHHALERMLGIQVARHNDNNGGHDNDDAPPPYSPAPPAYEEAANPGLQAPPVAAAGGARSVPTGSTNGNGAHAGAASNPPVSTTGPTSTLTTAGATSSSRGVDSGSASPAAGNPASSASTQGNATTNSDGTAATVGQPTTNQTVDQTAATPNGTPATTTTPASGATHQAPADAAAGAAAQPTTSAPDAVAATSTADTPGQAPPATPVGTATTSPDGVQQPASSHTSSASTSHDPGLSNAASPTSPTNQPPAASSSSAPTTAQAGLPLHYDGNAAAAAVNQPSPPPADTSSNATTATTTTTTPPSHQGQEITQSGTTPAAPQSGTTDPTADSAATPQNPAPQASASASQTTNPTTAQNTAAPTSASSQPAPSSRSTVAGPTAADTPLPLSHAESSAHGTSVRAPATAESATQPSASTAEATHARAEPSTEGAFGTRRPIEKPSDIEDLGRLAVQAAGKRAPGVVGPQWCLAVVDEFWQLSVPSRSAQGRAADTDARDRGAVWRGAVPPASWPPVTSFAAVRQGLGGAVPGRRAVVSMGRPSLGSGFGQIGHVFAVMSLPDGTLHAFDPGDGRGEPPRSFPADQLEQRARAILGTQVDLRWQVVETDGTPVAGLPSTVGSSSQISAMLDLGDTRRGAGRPHSPNSPDRRDDVPPAVSLPGPRSEALQGGSPGEPSEPKAAGRFVPKLASQSQALRPAPERAPEPRPDSTPEPNPPDTVKNPIDLNKPLPAVPGTAEPAPDLEQPSEATPAPDPQPQPDPTTEPDESTASDDSTEFTDGLEQSIT